MVIRCAVFRLRGKTNELWLITKKKDNDITRQEIADTYNAKFEKEDEVKVEIWSCDVEDIRQITNSEERTKLFKEVYNENKLFM